MLRDQRGALILEVRPDGQGAALGLRPGDRLLAIDGHPMRDLIDYRFYGDEDDVRLLVERQGVRHRLEGERDPSRGMGIEFDGVLFDGLRLCGNRCPFCFVEQMPRGLRSSLYVHDDDYRLSFLQGSFITLTNLDEADWARIAEQRLSPLYVSIHAADLALRRRLLGNPRAPDIIEQLQRLGDMGIRVHGQVVVVPGENDGQALEHTIVEIARLWPTVQTLALVPVGLTRCSASPLRLLTRFEAAQVLSIARQHRQTLKRMTGRTWLYPADEFYLLADESVPLSTFYDNPGQQENGVGLVRLLLDDWRRAKKRLQASPKRPRRFAIVCGTLIAPVMQRLAAEWMALGGWGIAVVPVSNDTFGHTVTVSGLLTGRDVVSSLATADVGEQVFLPRAMFDADGRVTLDDMTPGAIADAIGAAVFVAGNLTEVARALA